MADDTKFDNGHFKWGSLVRLKSGGPVMTIMRTGVTDDRQLCAWFDRELHCNHEFFCPDMLEPVTKEQVAAEIMWAAWDVELRRRGL